MKNHDPSNTIHHTAIIGENVSLGINNIIGPYCFITGDTTIGNGNKFEDGNVKFPTVSDESSAVVAGGV